MNIWDARNDPQEVYGRAVAVSAPLCQTIKASFYPRKMTKREPVWSHLFPSKHCTTFKMMEYCNPASVKHILISSDQDDVADRHEKSGTLCNSIHPIHNAVEIPAIPITTERQIMANELRLRTRSCETSNQI